MGLRSGVCSVTYVSTHPEKKGYKERHPEKGRAKFWRSQDFLLSVPGTACKGDPRPKSGPNGSHNGHGDETGDKRSPEELEVAVGDAVQL